MPTTLKVLFLCFQNKNFVSQIRLQRKKIFLLIVCYRSAFAVPTSVFSNHVVSENKSTPFASCVNTIHAILAM